MPELIQVIQGHVFCRDCLQEALIRSATCPTCRMPCSYGWVHKIICTYDDDRLEGLAWRDIHRSVRVGSGHEQRKALLRRNLESTIVRERPDMLMTIDIALHVMRLLVKTEKDNHKLEGKLEAARNLEENLRNEISSLKRSLSNVAHLKYVLSPPLFTVTSQASVLASMTGIPTLPLRGPLIHYETARPLSRAYGSEVSAKRVEMRGAHITIQTLTVNQLGALKIFL
ncbi:hypothetical protein FRC12_009240 [Ceratobasidium sp. 428]|nr:hypothetical protein FRC12_009240 [Ceratobasidium sp. 428]